MPLKRSGRGWKFGDKGKTYTGVGARAKAARQGRAIKAAQARRRSK